MKAARRRRPARVATTRKSAAVVRSCSIWPILWCSAPRRYGLPPSRDTTISTATTWCTDAVTAVLAALDRYDELRASLRTFVERVASNGIASTLRRARAAKLTSVDYWQASESPKLSVIVELRLDLNRALGTLGRPERRVARLLEEYRPAEIARALGISRTAVYRSIDRIREAFVEAGLG
jgi:RNA polymerase sigma factor (sigma-70 family)